MEDFSSTRRERFGPLLRLARDAAGTTPTAITRPLGLTTQALRNWEHGIRTPSLELLDAIEKRIPGTTPGRLVSIVYDVVPCPNSVDAITAVGQCGLTPARLAAVEAVLHVFLEGRPPFTPGPNTSAVDMSPRESIQEDSRLTDDEKLRVIGLVDLLLADHSAVVTP